jgi:hypothetical protein
VLSLGNSIVTSNARQHEFSLNTNGTNQYLDFGNTLNLGTSDFTISFWVKFSDATDQRFFSKYQGNDDQLIIRTASSDKIFVKFVKDSNAVVSKTAPTAITSLQNTWIHILLSCDRDGAVNLYVNNSNTGVGFSETSANSSQNLDNTGSLQLSEHANSFSALKITDFAMWNVALDSDAVAAVYNSGKPFNLLSDRGNYDNSSSLMGYWKIGDGPFDNKLAGLIHDTHNPGYGPELLGTAYDFSSDSGWAFNADTGWSIDTTARRARRTGHSVNSDIRKNITVEAEAVYELRYKRTYVSGHLTTNCFSEWVTDGSNTTIGSFNDPVNNSVVVIDHFRPKYSGTLSVRIFGINDFDGFLEYVSCRKVNGFPGLTSITFDSSNAELVSTSMFVSDHPNL